VIALLLVTAAGAAAQNATVVLVRHAEKADASADPVLSGAGKVRALALADALADAGVGAIITTQFQRTRLTAAPLGERVGVTPAVVAAASGRDHAEDVAAKVRELAESGTVVVVGHSNTVPAIVKALGGPDVGAIDDSSYDNLFVVTITEAGARVIRTRFGAAH
jgi:broad specificity phosphatase PhoE